MECAPVLYKRQILYQKGAVKKDQQGVSPVLSEVSGSPYKLSPPSPQPQQLME